VIIPSKNVRNLMLKREVIDAVQEGQFHIYPISLVEEGIEILTGIEAGAVQPDGTYPEGTLFRKVDDRLNTITNIVKAFGKDTEGGAGKSDDNGGGCPTCPR
jgi:predicted ATP-dependent protease